MSFIDNLRSRKQYLTNKACTRITPDFRQIESISPDSDFLVGIVHDVLSLSECNLIKKLGEDKLSESYTAFRKTPTKVRTSKDCPLDLEDKQVFAITKKIASLVGLPVEHCEEPILVRYLPGERYEAHYDSLDLELDDPYEIFRRTGGNRVITAILYLNQVDQGGDTYFTNLDLKITPKQGSVIIFQDVEKHNAAIPHPLSRHTGMPVEQGEKWIVNFWFRHQPYKNMATYDKYITPTLDFVYD